LAASLPHRREPRFEVVAERFERRDADGVGRPLEAVDRAEHLGDQSRSLGRPPLPLEREQGALEIGAALIELVEKGPQQACRIRLAPAHTRLLLAVCSLAVAGAAPSRGANSS